MLILFGFFSIGLIEDVTYDLRAEPKAAENGTKMTADAAACGVVCAGAKRVWYWMGGGG